MDSDAYFNMALEEATKTSDRLFTAEESNGQFIDLNNLYVEFKNLKKLKKAGVCKADNYLAYLQLFYKLDVVPVHAKLNAEYGEYTNKLLRYLKDFIHNSQPLLDFEGLQNEYDLEFKQQWQDRTLHGWETIINRVENTQKSLSEDPLFCAACNRTFSNEAVFKHHKKGKKHIRAINKDPEDGAEGGEEVKGEFTDL